MSLQIYGRFLSMPWGYGKEIGGYDGSSHIKGTLLTTTFLYLTSGYHINQKIDGIGDSFHQVSLH